jgi:excisionase family DNA binding protein
MNLRRLCYSKQEAAYALSCGTTKIDELIGTGLLKAVKSGRRLLIPAEDLERFLHELPLARLKPHSNPPVAKARRAAERESAA